MIKKILKICFWLLLLAIIGFGIFCYEKMKDGTTTNNTTSNLDKITTLQREKDKEEKLAREEERKAYLSNIENYKKNNNKIEQENPNVNDYNSNIENGETNPNNNNNKDGNNTKNKIKGFINKVAEKTGNIYKSAKDIAKNPNEYDTYNFDLSILLFEGEKEGREVVKLLDRLLNISDDRLYTNTTVTYKNRGNVVKTCTYSYETHDRNSYISSLMDVKNSISDNSKYNISFGYNKFKTHVNEIIIDKE